LETLDFSTEGTVALVRLNRPGKLNAVSPQMVEELRTVVRRVKDDSNLRVVIFTGAGRAFSAGADIEALTGMRETADFMRFIEAIQETYNSIEDLGLPTIAALNGLAYGGGCELALACDLRVMADDATIGVPEILIGVLPGAGGTQRLSRMLPPAIARQMIYLGDPLTAQEALGYGLVNAVVAADQVLETAHGIASRLAQLPRIALRSAKLLVHAGSASDLKTGIEAERQAVAFLFTTRDREEGMRAFLEKRTAHFEGR
jgi:enoyl-CoA hydratase